MDVKFLGASQSQKTCESVPFMNYHVSMESSVGIVERAIAAITNTGNPLVVEGLVSTKRRESSRHWGCIPAPVGNRNLIGRTVFTQQEGAAVSDVISSYCSFLLGRNRSSNEISIAHWGRMHLQ